LHYVVFSLSQQYVYTLICISDDSEDDWKPNKSESESSEDEIEESEQELEESSESEEEVQVKKKCSAKPSKENARSQVKQDKRVVSL
jgi:hypothetical protein